MCKALAILILLTLTLQACSPKLPPIQPLPPFAGTK